MRRLVLVVMVMTVSGAICATGESPPVGYTDTPELPSGWRVHDPDRPQPVVVTPAARVGEAPSDAVILFDGTDLSEWSGSKQDNPDKSAYNPDGKALWKVEAGYVECNSTGAIGTKKTFGDCQFHIEWQTSADPEGASQHRGNSGILMMGRYEIQILDCFENRTYADGSAGSIYGQTPPMVNACRRPGEWQVYDVIFQAPRFEGDTLISPAFVTVFLNGVLIQHKTEILGPTKHRTLPAYTPHGPTGPILLQDHNNPTRFRNIWIRSI